MNEPIKAEELVLIHRYLYYVLTDPVIPDHTYDVLERKARAICPPESKVHGIGSSLESNYPEEIKAKALRLLKGEQT